MSKINWKDIFKNANYYPVDPIRVESNCSDFQETGSSPQKLKEIYVEWGETFLFDDESTNESGRFRKRFKSIVHARSFAMSLIMEQVNTTMLKEEEYEFCDGWDSKDEGYSHDAEITKVLFGSHWCSGANRYLIIEYVFDFDEK